MLGGGEGEDEGEEEEEVDEKGEDEGKEDGGRTRRRISFRPIPHPSPPLPPLPLASPDHHPRQKPLTTTPTLPQVPSCNHDKQFLCEGCIKPQLPKGAIGAWTAG